MESGKAIVFDVMTTPLGTGPTGGSRATAFRPNELKPERPVITSIEGASELDVASAFYGKSVGEITAAFEKQGFEVKVTVSTKSSSATPPTLIDIKGTSTCKLTVKSINQIEFHPGGGIHNGAYYRIGTNSPTKYKVIDPATYKEPSAKERCQYIWVDGVDAAMPKGDVGVAKMDPEGKEKEEHT